MKRKLLLIIQYKNWLHGLTVQLPYFGLEETVITNSLWRIAQTRYVKITWWCVNTTKNPEDFGSRGMSVAKMGELWWKGPGWLRGSNNWPSDIKRQKQLQNHKNKARITKDMITKTTLKGDVLDETLKRYSYWKFLRITSWIQRFLHNCKRLKSERQSRPLKTKEIESSEILWLKTTKTNIQNTT